MEIVVFGAGSLGSLVGGMLSRTHDVTLVGREGHVRQVQNEGLSIVGEIDETVRPAATTDGTGLDADLAVVTVKSYDTEAAANALATGTIDTVLSLQNGLGNEALLATPLDCPVLAGTASYGAMLERAGRIRCTGVGEITLGDRTGGESALAERVAVSFADAGLAVTAATDMPLRLWRKLAVNAGINPLTALASVENAAVLEPPGRDVAERAACETARVARAHGIELGDGDATETLASVARATATNTSSMLQDVNANNRTEIDAIGGEIVERGTATGVDTPTVETLTNAVRSWERARDLR